MHKSVSFYKKFWIINLVNIISLVRIILLRFIFVINISIFDVCHDDDDFFKWVPGGKLLHVGGLEKFDISTHFFSLSHSSLIMKFSSDFWYTTLMVYMESRSSVCLFVSRITWDDFFCYFNLFNLKAREREWWKFDITLEEIS